MDYQNNRYDILTVVKLLAPKETATTLVPLNQIEETEQIFLWSAIFVGIFAAILGGVFALVSTAYENRPVIYLLILFLITFGLLSVFFSRQGFDLRKDLRTNNRNAEAARQDAVSKKMNQLRSEAILYRFHRDLCTKVFGRNSTVDLTEFNKNLNKLLPSDIDDSLHKQLVSKMIEEGMIILDKQNGDKPRFSFNPEYVYDYQES